MAAILKELEETQDYYELLGVKATASAQEIKGAYRRIALRFHPDSSRGRQTQRLEELFKRITAAYSTLSHSESRREYDRRRNPRLDSSMSLANLNGNFGRMTNDESDDCLLAEELPTVAGAIKRALIFKLLHGSAAVILFSALLLLYLFG